MMPTGITLDNKELYSWGLFFLIILLSLAVGSLSRFFLFRLSEKTTSASKKKLLGVIFKAIANPIMCVAFVLGFRGAIFVLELTPKLHAFLDTILGVLNAVTIGYFIYSMVDIVDYWLDSWAKRTESKVDDVLAPLVGKAIRITVMVLVILNVVVEVSGKDLTTILASLGVGGLAIALAGQDTIKNFFGSLVIFGDKPFEIGD
jgi:MscS family membrane protein